MRTPCGSIDELMTPCTSLLDDAKVRHPYVVWADTPVAEVLGEMLTRRVGSALVVDQRSLQRGRVVGIFTAVDAVKALEEMTRGGS